MRSLISKALRANNPSLLISSTWQLTSRQFGSLATDRLTDREKETFSALAEGESTNPYKDYLSVQKKSGEILEEILSSELKDNLRSFGSRGRSIFFLQNCPTIGNSKILPPTPPLDQTSPQRSKSKDNVSEYFMLGISGLLRAEPYLIENVRDGTVINQIIPTNAYSNSGSGYKVPFGLHNEVVHEPKVPDFFLLLALRGNPLAKTNYCFLDDIISVLPPQILEELKKPNFLMKSGDAAIFKEAKEFRCPIITTDKNGTQNIKLNTAPGRCEGLTEEAKIALKYLNECLSKDVPIHGIALQDGEMLIIENGTTLHGRTEFEGDRWVQRMNLNQKASSSTKNQVR
jgi:hypothetical protein